MIVIGSKINKNFAWEWSGFHFYRGFDDGIDWINFSIESDFFEMDHNPQFTIRFVILNFILFDLCIHNIHHIKTKE